MTDTQYDEDIRLLYSRGWRVPRIAKFCKIGISSVYVRLNAVGIELRGMVDNKGYRDPKKYSYFSRVADHKLPNSALCS